jgi:hypothetical protein
MSPDLVNGLFEFGGALALAVSVRKLLKDRQLRGMSWISIAFFSAWGVWNLAYYPFLKQWFSLAGGSALVAVNVVYVALLIRYSLWPDPRE